MSKGGREKYEPSLVYTSLLEAVSDVRKYGAKKYGSTEDWETTEPVRHLDAAIRHIRAHIDGEYLASDSELSHLAHAASNIMFEIERIRRRRARARHVIGNTIEAKCPRCGSRDEYPVESVLPCTAGCGYLIDSTLVDFMSGPEVITHIKHTLRVATFGAMPQPTEEQIKDATPIMSMARRPVNLHSTRWHEGVEVCTQCGLNAALPDMNVCESCLSREG